MSKKNHNNSTSIEDETTRSEETSEEQSVDITPSVDENQTLSLVRQGATNNYKLGGTLVIKYKQSDNSIKGDTGVNKVTTILNPILNIKISNTFEVINILIF